MPILVIITPLTGAGYTSIIALFVNFKINEKSLQPKKYLEKSFSFYYNFKIFLIHTKMFSGIICLT